MAFAAGNQTRVYCNGYDLSAYLSQVGLPGEAEAYDVTTFTKTSHVYIGGLTTGRLSGSGFFDADDTSAATKKVDDILAAALGASTETVWTVCVPADVVGNRARVLGSVDTKYEVSSPYNGAVAVAVEAASSYGMYGAVILKALGSTAAATVNGTGVDNAVSTANGGVAALQVTVQAATSVVTKVQHSSDNSTYADLITFATTTAAPAAEVKEVTGTVNRYTRSQVAATGGTVTTSVAFGRK
jgi:hypothetical protein